MFHAARSVTLYYSKGRYYEAVHFFRFARQARKNARRHSARSSRSHSPSRRR
ncbi:MAG: tetratricopeptide repeat protein [Oscillospiraceae bacterium]|nr:tetratricopeptide repeat protein [Oscillospiraceae bacterium]